MSTYSFVLAAANITGVVYNDYNGNGVRDNATGAIPGVAVDGGVPDVTVKAFDENGINCATATTAANGTYTLPMGPCSGTEFRVEFSNLPPNTEPTQFGGQNATTTQFVNEGGTANLGINQIGNFCQNNPVLAMNCYRGGDRLTSPTSGEQLLTGSRYNATDDDDPTLNLGTQEDIGTTYGLAYRKSTRTVYTSTFYKRHADIGPGGMGAIYSSGPIPASGTGTVAPAAFAAIPNVGADRHPVSDTDCDGRDGSLNSGTPAGGFSCWRWDTFSFNMAGKASLGDMDIYEAPTGPADDALFVMNLNDRNMYKLTDLDGSPAVSAPIATPLALPGAVQGCAVADVRPFALTIYNGVGYAGLTCTAESTQNAANLRAYVYTFDPTTNTFGSAPVLEIPLNFQRTCYKNCSSTNIGDWRPWADTFGQFAPGISVDGSNFEVVYATPLLSDISLGATPTEMTLGFRDRSGDQWAEGNSPPDDLSDTDRYFGIPMGDIMRACLVGSTWTLENGGTCNGSGPGANPITNFPARGQGPGGFEFYNHDYMRFPGDDESPQAEGEEVTVGGLAAIPGAQEVVETAWGVIDVPVDSGIIIHNVNTGGFVNAHAIYGSTDANTLGKVNGLGDVEVLCDLAPVEVGNRIWRDSNDNGVQDAGEPAIAGVTVRLYDSSDNLLSTVVTDTDGGYYFSNRTVDENGNPLSDSTGKDYGITGFITNTTDYRIRLDNPADYTDPTKLEGLTLTFADSTQDDGNNQNDSDGGLPGSGGASAANAPFVAFNTGFAGANNHTYDFGFVLASSVVTPPTDGGGAAPGPSPPSGSAGGLADTGQNILILLAAQIVLLTGGSALFYYYRRRFIQDHPQ